MNPPIPRYVLLTVSNTKIVARKQVLTIPPSIRAILIPQTMPIEMEENIVIDWVAAVAAVPKFDSNLPLLGNLNLTPTSALYFKKNLYETGDRCKTCFLPHHSGDCIFPSFYDETPLKWINRCIVCHDAKRHTDQYLCGAIPCALTFILITNPTQLHINETRSIPIEWI